MIMASTNLQMSWFYQDIAPGLASSDIQLLHPALLRLDFALTLRTYLSGHRIGRVDEQAWTALRTNNLVNGLVRQGRMPMNVLRWLTYIDAVHPEIQQDFKVSQARIRDHRAAASRAGANYNVRLVDTDNGVVTRFPPEPSGYLHIGHAKAAILNDYFAHEAYQGKLIVRFDDTNPATESQEFEISILSDLELLGIRADRVTYTSDYFTQLQTYAEQMILDGNAYADDTPAADLADQRAKRLPSPRRDRPVEDNLAIFQEMVSGSITGRRHCLRARLKFDALNGALRDPIIYRFPKIDTVTNKERPHHRTGWNWKIYPTYDFACPVVDSLEGVTHALRTTEYTDRNEQYQWFLSALRLRQVHIWDFARINFVHTFLSKRKLKQVIETGLVSGWDDPRMPTIRGIIRRGLTISALRQFMLRQGPSRNAVSMDWTIMWALNQKVIDPIATRLTAVETKRTIAAHISNGPAQLYFESKPKHPKQLALGTRPVAFSSTILLDQADGMTFGLGEEITLMKWGNAIVNRIDKDGDIITGLELRLHLKGDFRKTEKKVTWLAAAEGENKLTRAQLWTFDHLLDKDTLNKDDKLEEYINPKSANMSEVLCDADLTRLKEGDIVQMERKGFFRLDKAAAKGTDWRVILFKIPSASKTRSDGASRSSVV